MRHSIEWQDDAVNAAPEERATVGDLRLFIRDKNVTQHLLDGQVGDHVTIAPYGLAHGLVHVSPNPHLRRANGDWQRVPEATRVGACR